MKKNEKPTSFSLDAELLERLRQAAHDLRTTRTGFVQSALADWLDRAAAGQVAVDPETSEPRLTHSGDSPIPNSSTPPPPAGLLEFPSLLAALPPDDAWLLHQLARILKDRPQGDIFAILETTLHKAVRAYVATQPATTNKVDSGKSPTLKSSVVRVDIPELDLPWVQKLLKIRRSPKPGLNRALREQHGRIRVGR